MSQSATYKIFLIEDDLWYSKLLNHHLSLNDDYDVSIFNNGKTALSNLHEKPDLVCMDFGLPDIEGINLLNKLKAHNPDLPVIVISAQEDISVAVELLKAGADDYIIKDEFTKDMLWRSVIKLRENTSLKQEVLELKAELANKYDFQKSIVGQSAKIKGTFNLLQKAVSSNINVHISGETGTGKEVYAKAIHYNSDRKKAPFVAVNMSAIPSELIESELFGHEKGAFTGANSSKLGKFQEADGGTLFLDEIGDIDPEIQTKLLRVLQEREVTKVGGNKAKKINIRLITATHKNLSTEVKNGNFREDFFFRIMGLPIHLPPLRERENDVIILAKHFTKLYAKENGTAEPVLNESAKKKLKKHAFPGNVRELKAAIDLACVMCNDNTISEEDLNFYDLGNSKPYNEEEKTLKEFENEIIGNYLKKYNENVLLVADKLKVGKSKIYNLLKSGEIILN